MKQGFGISPFFVIKVQANFLKFMENKEKIKITILNEDAAKELVEKESQNIIEQNNELPKNKEEAVIYTNPKIQKSKKTSRINKSKGGIIFRLAIYSTIFLLTGTVVFGSQMIISGQNSSSWIFNLPIVKQIKHLAESADQSLKGEDLDRINILLLGMGGKNHDGGYLTDTIMLASLEPSTKKASLVSIPRDLSIPVEDMGYKKINSINAYAEMNSENSGGLAISQAISDILNVPIDYYFRVDFTGFVNIIDELDGIVVNVENTLDDYSYPIKGRETAEDYASRFEHLHVDAGKQKMDGSLALKYARSRHAVGVEGSDFARAKRQQIIIEAVKDKLLSTNLLLKPTTVASIINEFQENISTNLKVWEMIKLWSMFKDITRDDITNRVLDNNPNGLLVDMITEEGAYVLTPRSGDFSEIQYFVNNIFSDAPIEKKTEVSEEHATVEVRNGTWINGLASQTALDLERYGFTVARIGNSSRQNFQKSVIYDLTYGEKDKSLQILREKTGANISFGLPDWLVDEIESELVNEKNPIQPDFILIIGQDADTTDSGTENIIE